MPVVDFIYFDAGGGHRAAATALKSVIERQQRPWQIRLVNLQELLDPIDVFRNITGLRLQDLYNMMLKRGWTLGSGVLTRGMQLIIRLYHGREVRSLERFWSESRPALVVSLVPNLNRALRESLARALPAAPYVTILTDIADYPPHFWIERQDQYLICGSDRAVEQARGLGHPDRHIFRVSGMILRPIFYEPLTVDRAAERRRLGLNPDLPTGLVLFGGQGSRVMARIVRSLDGARRKLQLILICGRNEKLAARLRAMKTGIPKFVEGFTDRIPYYMSLADFFIGKPGPGSVSEALAMKLPVIVERNAWTLPQERYNARWVSELGAGIVLRSFGDVGRAVDQMLVPAAFTRFRESAARVENRAVFEIPDILEKILCEHSSR